MNWLTRSVAVACSLVMLGSAVSAAAYTSKLSKLKNNLEVTGNLTVDGAATLGGATPVTTTGNANQQIAKARVFSLDIGPGQALANGTTFQAVIAPGRACTVTQISVAAQTKPVGGVNTLAVKKNNGNTMLNAATFDPTTITANNASQALPLTATPADLTLTATDTITVTYVSGTQGTAAVAPTVSVETLPSDY